jgi:hypothetical protein
VPPNALDRMLEQYPGGVMSGWENDVCE